MPYGSVADRVDEYIKIGKTSALDCLKHYVGMLFHVW